MSTSRDPVSEGGPEVDTSEPILGVVEPDVAVAEQLTDDPDPGAEDRVGAGERVGDIRLVTRGGGEDQRVLGFGDAGVGQRAFAEEAVAWHGHEGEASIAVDGWLGAGATGDEVAPVAP